MSVAEMKETAEFYSQESVKLSAAIMVHTPVTHVRAA